MTLVAYERNELALRSYFHHLMAGMGYGPVITYTGDSFMKTGNGKSHSSVGTSMLVDDDFNLDDKLVYYPREYMNTMDLIEEIGKPCQMSVVDECEIMAGSAMYHSFVNKAIFYNLATNRFLRSMSIMNTPSFSWIDKRIRQLVSHWGIPQKSMTSGGKIEVNLRLWRIKTDDFGDNLWRERLKMYHRPSDRVVVFKSFKVPKLPDHIAEAYEKKSRGYKSDFRKSLLPMIEKLDETTFKEEKRTPRQIADQIAENKELLKKLQINGRLSLEEIRDHFMLTYSEARRVKNAVQRMFNGA